MKTLYLLFALALCALPSALSVSFSSNRTYADSDQLLTLSMNATGGAPPYFFTLYEQNGTQFYRDGYLNATVQVRTLVNQNQYRLRVEDTNGNETNATLALTVNAPPTLVLSPTNATIQPPYYIQFSNTTLGGTPPFSYNYAVQGSGYSVSNNTVTFNDTGLYLVTLMVNDLFGKTAHATALIDSAYAPTVHAMGECENISNFSQTEVVPLSLGSGAYSAIEDFMTPDYASVIISSPSYETAVTLNSTTAYVPAGATGIYVRLLSIGWIPKLHVISVQVCEGNPTTSSTTSAPTTTTFTGHTTTIEMTTTVPISSTTLLSTTTRNSTATRATPTGPDSLLVCVAMIVLILVVGILFMVFRKPKEEEG